MKYGLIGERLGHSFSKVIHEKIADYTYELREVPRDGLELFMQERAFLGINVTVPYKSAVIPYLDYIDPFAGKIGAVNTVVNRDGKLYGYNTDYGGLSLLTKKAGFDYKDKKVLILGSGGTSHTARAVAEGLGAGEIVTVSRGGEVNYENVYTLHGDADFIINTTPVGMYPDSDGCVLSVENFSRLSGVTDVVYNPIKTRLCLEAENRGIKSVNGLFMLVCQAVLACSLFTGKELDTEKISEEIYKELLKEKQNIVLIGMPGSGKSTIGRALAEKLGRRLYDTDEIITSRYGSISDIFSEKGEACFRDLEAEAVKEVSVLNGAVIATGGGAVLRKENVEALKQNGILFFLNRPLVDIIPTDDRPLSRDNEALKKRFEERYDIYVSSADKEIYVDGDVKATVSRILESLQ